MNSTRNTLTSLFKNKIKYTFSVGGNVIIVIRGDDNYKNEDEEERLVIGSPWARRIIIIGRKFFFLLIGREPTTWPANNCLQIMLCLCAMLSNCVWLQIVFCWCVNETCFSPSCDCSGVKMADCFAFKGYSLKRQTRWSNDKTIIELGYRKILWFVSVSQINN